MHYFRLIDTKMLYVVGTRQGAHIFINLKKKVILNVSCVAIERFESQERVQGRGPIFPNGQKYEIIFYCGLKSDGKR